MRILTTLDGQVCLVATPKLNLNFKEKSLFAQLLELFEGMTLEERRHTILFDRDEEGAINEAFGLIVGGCITDLGNGKKMEISPSLLDKLLAGSHRRTKFLPARLEEHQGVPVADVKEWSLAIVPV